MRNVALDPCTIQDIDDQVAKVLRGIGDPAPPLDLPVVRELLKLDRGFYSTTDDYLLRETFSRLKVAGIQVLKRPTLLADAVRSLSLKALYLPDQKRILLDRELPPLKHRWNEAHEIGHDIIPWHEGMMLGDTMATLTPNCHETMEAEANYAAGRLLFMGARFRDEALDGEPSLDLSRRLAATYGNTITSTLWRLVEQASGGRPMVAMVSGHPHASRRNADFDPANPCRYFVRSPEFRGRFDRMTERQLFDVVAGYCGSQSGGLLGHREIVLVDVDRERHVFEFETFYNRYEALTLGKWLRGHDAVIAMR